MLMSAVDRYLDVRRRAGFQLKSIEYYLRDFARFATERGETHVVYQQDQIIGRKLLKPWSYRT